MNSIEKEIKYNYSKEFKKGAYIYMGMGVANNHCVCISVGYKIDYCLKKAEEFTEAAPNVTFAHINKVKVGEAEPCEKFII